MPFPEDAHYSLGRIGCILRSRHDGVWHKQCAFFMFFFLRAKLACGLVFTLLLCLYREVNLEALIVVRPSR